MADLLGDLQPELQVVPEVKMALTALGSELERVEAAGSDLVSKMFPANADDTYGTLGLWESLLDLPVEPAGVTVAARVRSVTAAAKSRHVASAVGWGALITEILGSSGWTHSESAYAVTVNLLGLGTSYSAGQVAQIIRRVTPAHLSVTVNP
jgi:hypothetical protein